MFSKVIQLYIPTHTHTHTQEQRRRDGKEIKINGKIRYKMAINIGLAKKFLWFVSKNKIHFSFSPRTLLNNVFTIFFHYLLPFSRKLHNSIFAKLFLFLGKELFQMPFIVFQGIEFFPWREFCKDRNKWKSEGAMSG